jgi:hypothetical protein
MPGARRGVAHAVQHGFECQGQGVGCRWASNEPASSCRSSSVC